MYGRLRLVLGSYTLRRGRLADFCTEKYTLPTAARYRTQGRTRVVRDKFVIASASRSVSDSIGKQTLSQAWLS